LLVNHKGTLPWRHQTHLAEMVQPVPMPREVPEEVHGKWRDHRARLRCALDAHAVPHAAWVRRHEALLSALGADLSVASAMKEADSLQVWTPEALPQPAEVQLPLRDHQLDGLSWLVWAYETGISCILGDEMGLGKTLQTIAFLAHLRFVRSVEGPYLIVCPLTVLSHWVSEFHRCCPSMRLLSLHGTQKDYERLWTYFWDGYPHHADVVVTTYEVVRSWANQFAAARWQVLVLDEGHIIKNEKSCIAKALRRILSVQAVMLTGTPIQCDLHELWSLMNFLHPRLFRSSAAFDKACVIRGAKGVAETGPEHTQMMDRMHELVNLCMLRRLKRDVEHELPPKVETKIECPLSSCQVLWYKRLLLRGTPLLRHLEKSVSGGKGARGKAWRELRNLMMQLRKVCNHPYILPGADPHPGIVNQAFLDASGKFQLFDRLLSCLLRKKHRCLVFSQFTKTLDKIEALLQWRSIPYCRLDGSVARDRRTADIAAFNAAGSQMQVFLLTTRAGGLGINLQTSDTCIIFDSDWNPQLDTQAMARAHRIGQRHVVHVYRLVSKGTIEERILSKAGKRLYLDSIIVRDQLRSVRDDARSTGTALEDGLEMLRFGSDTLVSDGACGALSDAELEAITDRRHRVDTSEGGVLRGGGIAVATSSFNAQGASADEGAICVLNGVRGHGLLDTPKPPAKRTRLN